MQKSTRWMGILVAVASSTALACGGGGDGGGNDVATGDVPAAAGMGGTVVDPTGPGNVVAGSGSPAGSDTLTGLGLPNTGDINLLCPEVAPLDGPQAAHGACCHRVSNIEREAMLEPNEQAPLEYRVQYQAIKNHPKTLGDVTLTSVGTARADTEQQSLLFRFEGPRMNGEEVSGPGKTTIANGRYNCDGSYSFFSEAAAPARGREGRDAPTRWAARPVPTMVDVTKHGRDRSHVAWADNANRDLSYLPFLDAATWALDWELATQGFDIETIDTEGAMRDCIGSRNGPEWSPGGTYRVYVPLAPNLEPITSAMGQTMCGLTAFGLSVPDPMHDCATTPRCTPGSAGCTWVKLPDSLCPSTPAEQAMWGCHVGAEDNEGDADFPDGYPTNCTAEPPTAALDPDHGAASEGQCCDPLGQSPTLPACNAWILREDYVAAAAEITDEPSNALPQACQ